LAAIPAGLVRRDGVFTWVSSADAEAGVRSGDGTVVPGQAVAILDVPSLADGLGPGGRPLSTSRYVVHPEGQRPLTAVGVALGVERLLGLRGDPVPPGLHTPEALVDPAYAVERMVEAGTTLTDAPRGG
jgi:hypothetical protein